MSCRGFEPVCTNDEARAYFKDKGLRYADITDGDIAVLAMFLSEEIKKSNKTGETSVNTMYLSKKIRIIHKPNGTIIKAFLYMNSHYFTQRECISFNEGGFIGFAGWADEGNTNPILRAFLRWCDKMDEQKQRQEQKKNGCHECEYRGSEDCSLELGDDGNFFCPNGRLV